MGREEGDRGDEGTHATGSSGKDGATVTGTAAAGGAAAAVATAAAAGEWGGGGGGGGQNGGRSTAVKVGRRRQWGGHQPSRGGKSKNGDTKKAPPQVGLGTDVSVDSTAGSILSTPPPVLPTVAAAHPQAAAEHPPGAAAVPPPSPLPPSPPPLSALTLRLVKSFAHRNVALIVLLDVNLATTSLAHLLARARARVAVDESGSLLPYAAAAAKADTGRVHVAGAHRAKDGGLAVAGGDGFIPPGVPLADLGVAHEGEVTLFNRLDYEEFVKSGSPMIW